jgi:hypothetical protein
MMKMQKIEQSLNGEYIKKKYYFNYRKSKSCRNCAFLQYNYSEIEQTEDNTSYSCPYQRDEIDESHTCDKHKFKEEIEKEQELIQKQELILAKNDEN